MKYKLHQISIIAVFLSILFFAGCEAGHHDYYYVARYADTTGNGSYILTYLLNGRTEPQTRELKPGDTIHIYERKGVSGDDIWDIETSATLYAIRSIVAAKNDSSEITEELSPRTFWSLQSGTGVYELRIDNSMFKLKKQLHSYLIHNETDTAIFVRVQKSLQQDTIGEAKILPVREAEIYAYTTPERDSIKYRESLLSGISSLSIIYKGISREINLNKPYLYNWNFDEPEKSILTVDKSIFD